ncbi:MAG: protein-export chaperone SecB [Paludibacteraceae bacterium]|nr:protein-export chaperone SecB [Paludibacteraceae bacterium]
MEEEKKNIESGFRIHNILLIESNFSRIETVEFNNPEIIQNVNIEVAVNVNPENNMISVKQTLHYSQEFNGVEQVMAVISMIGVFEKYGDSPLDLEQFGHVNGAAIIYPYIREHLSNLSAKAGLGLIFLPPVNLTKK